MLVAVYAGHGRICNDSSVPIWVSTAEDFTMGADAWSTFALSPGDCTPWKIDGEGIWTYRNYAPGEANAECELLILKARNQTVHVEDDGRTSQGTYRLKVAGGLDSLEWIPAATRTETWALAYSDLSLSELEADINYYIQTQGGSNDCNA
jgi:hypothetical protein